MLEESSASADENWSLGIVLLSPAGLCTVCTGLAKLHRVKRRASPLWASPSMTSTDLAAPALLLFRCYQALVWLPFYDIRPIEFDRFPSLFLRVPNRYSGVRLYILGFIFLPVFGLVS
jgi:hypothetical protein